MATGAATSRDKPSQPRTHLLMGRLGGSEARRLLEGSGLVSGRLVTAAKAGVDRSIMMTSPMGCPLCSTPLGV